MAKKLKDIFFLEAGYAGQGHTSGAESFLGGYFGFGGTQQLANKSLNPATAKIKKLEDEEAIYNIPNQQKLNRGYPASEKVSGFAGGDTTGISSGLKYPNKVAKITLSKDEIKQLSRREVEDEYFGFNSNEELEEQAAGPQRGHPSDGNYRDLPGWPRPNSIEKQGNFVPEVEGDLDNNGEEDDYLSNAEYVNDVLRLNGVEPKKAELKKMFFNPEKEDKLQERTLYHGTIRDNYENIKKRGLSGEIGDWVKDSYGMSLDLDDWEERLDGITFAADKNNINAAVGAMRYHIGKKLNKQLMDVTEKDLLTHGMLVVLKDVEEAEPIKYPDDIDDGEWRQMPSSQEVLNNFYAEYPPTVEPGDWFQKGGVAVDQILTGNKMLSFLRRSGGLKNVLKDKKRRLIKALIKKHGAGNKKDIVKKVSSMSSNEIWSAFRDLQTENKSRSLKQALEETVVSPAYGPEPDRGSERYKIGAWEETPIGDDWLIKHVDFSGGHGALDAADESPGGHTYGQIGKPKDFVPEDWEQRHWKTKQEEEMSRKRLKAEENSKNEAYTGIHDKTGKGEPKGGSAAFEKNREEILEKLIEKLVNEALQERRVMSSKKLMKKLKKNKSPGCQHVRQKGSHAFYRCGICSTVVPMHGSKDVKPGTLKSIEKDLEDCLGDDWLEEK